MSLENLYNEMFPEEGLGKVAADVTSEKTAEKEERVGELAYESFEALFEDRMNKIAAVVASESVHDDSRPDQALAGNRPADAGSAIDTAAQEQNIVKVQSGAEVVGDEKQKDADTEKAASITDEDRAIAEEMYLIGHDKIALQMADELDKVAMDEDKKEESEEDKKEEKKELPAFMKSDEGEKKEASARAAFIEKGVFDGLQKIGSDRHKDSWHYLTPFLEEKVAALTVKEEVSPALARLMNVGK